MNKNINIAHLKFRLHHLEPLLAIYWASLLSLISFFLKSMDYGHVAPSKMVAQTLTPLAETALWLAFLVILFQWFLID